MTLPSSPAKPFGDLMQIFDYDRQSPLAIDDAIIENMNRAEVHDISYSSAGDGRIKAYLVKPTGMPSAGIIFVHPAPGDRSSFLDEAAALANMGAVSLLINATWAYPEFGSRAPGMTARDMRDMIIQTTKDIRRGADLILSQPGVDRIEWLAKQLRLKI